MRSLHQHAPKVVMVQDLNIWGVPWTKYGAEIESWIRKRYSPVIVDGEAERFVGARLYVFNDRAQDFVRCAHRQY